MSSRRSRPDDGDDLLTLLAEQESGPRPCPHGPSRGKNADYGWVVEKDPDSPYYREMVHNDPNCRRALNPGSLQYKLPTVGWSRKLQKDVPL